MDDLLLKQLAEGQLILNFLVNTDKNVINKTIPGLQARLQLLEDYWAKVLDRHGNLQPTDKVQPSPTGRMTCSAPTRAAT